MVRAVKTRDHGKRVRAADAPRSRTDVARIGAAILLGATMVVVLFLPGCGKRRPTPVKVTGTVTYRGQPVEGATVNFIPKKGRIAIAKTDADGRFALRTYEPRDGAIVGEYEVAIVKYIPNPGYDPSSPHSEEMIPVLPKRYANRATSELKASVTTDRANDFQFDLVD